MNFSDIIIHFGLTDGHEDAKGSCNGFTESSLKGPAEGQTWGVHSHVCPHGLRSAPALSALEQELCGGH